ncbi:MAG: hypothetical protein KA806_09655 [Sulfuritalea sp.]|nr:hypothetical protein [Sulfuritalea sp.]
MPLSWNEIKARFRLYDLHNDAVHEFSLAELHRNVRQFSFIAGYETQVIKPRNPTNIKAAERMGRLHDQLQGRGGHTDLDGTRCWPASDFLPMRLQT